jgi:hypothetical protein
VALAQGRGGVDAPRRLARAAGIDGKQMVHLPAHGNGVQFSELSLATPLESCPSGSLLQAEAVLHNPEAGYTLRTPLRGRSSGVPVAPRQ